MEDRGRWKLAAAAVVLAVAILAADELVRHLDALERWIGSHGLLGVLVFVAAVVVCTSLFLPDTLFAMAAGVLFGLGWGSVIVIVASLLTASLNFALSRRLLRARVRGWLEANPRLASIEEAVKREGLRFLFLLRLTPIPPVTVSYVLGATGTPYSTFLAASLGLIPALFVEVYFGYVASHLTKVAGGTSDHSPLHTGLTIGGMVLCVAVLVYVTRLARTALAKSEVTHMPAAGA